MAEDGQPGASHDFPTTRPWNAPAPVPLPLPLPPPASDHIPRELPSAAPALRGVLPMAPGLRRYARAQVALGLCGGAAALLFHVIRLFLELIGGSQVAVFILMIIIVLGTVVMGLIGWAVWRHLIHARVEVWEDHLVMRGAWGLPVRVVPFHDIEQVTLQQGLFMSHNRIYAVKVQRRGGNLFTRRLTIIGVADPFALRDFLQSRSQPVPPPLPAVAGA